MPGPSTAPYPFGDLLALARQSWVGEMERRLAARGYAGYRRTDAGALRMLYPGPLAVGELGSRLGVTRQAARKVTDGLEQRGYVTTARDQRDARQLNVTLTTAGREYARSIVVVIRELNHAVSRQVSAVQLAAADSVLRAALFDESARQRAARLPRPESAGRVSNG